MLSQKPWRGEAVLQMIGMIMVSLFGALLLGGALHQQGVAGFKSANGFGGVLLVTLGGQGAVWLFIPVFLKRHGLGWLEAFGLRDPGLKRAVGLALLVSLVVLPVMLALQQVSAMAMDALGWRPQVQTIVNLFAHAHSPWKLAYLVVFAVVITPVAEEFVFRGMLYPFIKQLVRPGLAALGVSLFFAAIHVNAPAFVPLLVFGLALTWLYEKTDCLLAPIVAHAAFNAANIVLFFVTEASSRPLPARL